MCPLDKDNTFLEFKKVVEKYFSGENVTPDDVYQATLEISRIAKSCAPPIKENVDAN